MLLSNNNRISLIRGTNCSLTVSITSSDGSPYVLTEGAIVRFGVKFNLQDDEYRIRKEITEGENGIFRIELVPEDTSSMSFGSYYYDIGIQEGAVYYNVIPASEFLIRPNVTGRED